MVKGLVAGMRTPRSQRLLCASQGPAGEQVDQLTVRTKRK